MYFGFLPIINTSSALFSGSFEKVYQFLTHDYVHTGGRFKSHDVQPDAGLIMVLTKLLVYSPFTRSTVSSVLATDPWIL